MLMDEKHNHDCSSAETPDPLNFQDTCPECKRIMDMVNNPECIAWKSYSLNHEYIDEIVEVCIYNNRTIDENIRLIAFDNPEWEAIAEEKQACELARPKLELRKLMKD